MFDGFHPKYQKSLGEHPVVAVCALSLERNESPALVAAAIDASVVVVSKATGDVVQRLADIHEEPITAIASNGKLMTVVAHDQRLSVWKIDPSEFTLEFACYIQLPSMAYACEFGNSKTEFWNHLIIGISSKLMCVNLATIIDGTSNPSPEQAIKLTRMQTMSHSFHASEITAVAVSSDGGHVISGDEDGAIIVANLRRLMPSTDGDVNSDDDDDDGSILQGSFQYQDSIARLGVVGSDLILVGSGTELISALKLSSLDEKHPNQSAILEQLKPSVAIREHASLEEDGSKGSIVGFLFDEPTSTSFALGSSSKGSMSLFKIGKHNVKLNSRLPGTEMGHSDLIRTCTVLGRDLITGGDDGKLCLWALRVRLKLKNLNICDLWAQPSNGKSPSSRSAPY